MENFSILCFSWNTQSVRLCESLDQNVVATNRSQGEGYLGMVGLGTTWRYDCNIMDLFTKMVEKIQQTNPSMVVFSFQEDVRPGSYAHSHLFQEEMPKYGYELYERNNLLGVGRTSYTGLLSADPFLRGLRISVYVRSNLKDLVTLQYPDNFYSDSYFVNKGAIAIYVTFANGQTLAIIDAHLPYNASSVLESFRKRDPFIRQNALNVQNTFYNNIIQQLFLYNDTNSSHILFMGDLNYRVMADQNWYIGNYRPTDIPLYDPNRDELKAQMLRQNIYLLWEGVNNNGPQFEPTCKMKKPRDPDAVNMLSYSLGKERQRPPAYCDRIMYSSKIDALPKLVCNEYGRIDYGITTRSDHASVYGLYTFLNA